MQLLRDMLEEAAISDPVGVSKLLDTVVTIEIDEVQSLIADTLAMNPALLKDYALIFLFADHRRLHLGNDMFDDESGIVHMISGWSSSHLIAQVIPHLSHDDIERIRDYIESWEPWKAELQEEQEVALRRSVLRWSDERRLRLLAELPLQVLTARRRRQVEEWKAEQTPTQVRQRGRMLARFVESPMNHEQMAKAKDDAIIKMLNTVNDKCHCHENAKDWLKGGVIELSRAFGAFVKCSPVRAIRIIPLLQSGLHEQAAGAAIQELSIIEEVSPKTTKALIWDLHVRGFSSRDFCLNAADAMQKIAKRMKGLEDRDINLLRSWLQRDPNVLAVETERHAELKKSNRELNEKPERRPQAMLFGRDNGILSIPQRNFTLLSAIAAAYLYRECVDYDGWIAELELHVTYPEDPEIWSGILIFRSHELMWADSVRVGELIEKIWRKFPGAFEDAAVARPLWHLRSRISISLQQEIVTFWLRHSDNFLRQIGGEFCAASVIVNNATSGEMFELVEGVMAGSDIFARCGVLFTAAAGWNEPSQVVRNRSHDYVIAAASIVRGLEAHALSTVVDRGERMPPDEMTRSLLTCVVGNGELLKGFMGPLFIRSLQHLLLYPDFEKLVLEIAEATTELTCISPEGMAGIYDGEFIGLVIALQRSPIEIKTRAMTIYEHLLDAEVHGAEDAAALALRH